MAPPGKDKEKEKDKERDDDDEYDSDEGDQSTTTSAPGILGPPGPPSPTDINSISKPYHPGPPHPPGPPLPVETTGGGASPLPGIQPTSSPSWTTYPVSASRYPEIISSSQPASLSSLSATYGSSWPTGSLDPGDGGGDGGGTRNPGTTHPGMYAAAAVTPIIVLVIIAAMVFLCMRKRKRRRQRHEPTVLEKVEESKMRSQAPPVVQAYMAPPLGASPQYAHLNNHLPPLTNPTTTQPIILGPIPSGSNGAYFTGIDTSDVVSMTSTNNFRPPPNPFSDNESLSEPPPPYRPRSIAPPSFSNSSRHSSFRAPNPSETSSQTQLIGRSPFDDPNDDAISELSGPTEGHGEAMSAVSDLSYQNEPVFNRPAL